MYIFNATDNKHALKAPGNIGLKVRISDISLIKTFMNTLQGGATMNKKYFPQISAILMSATITAASCPAPAVIRAADQDIRGKSGDYAYEMWNMNYDGQVDFTPEDDGTLKLKASGDFGDVLLTKGTEFQSKYKYSSYGKITASYDFDYSSSGTEDNPSHFFLGVYGWTEHPTAEYYIIEGWSNWRPPGTTYLIETTEIDGALYDIYITYRNNMGGIQGTMGNPTYWSIRRENKIDGESGNVQGSVTVSDHFKVWEKHGFNSDALLYNTTVFVEGYRSAPFEASINSCEILTEYSKEQIAEMEPAVTTVTDPEITLSEPEDTEPAVTEPLVPKITEPADTEPVITDITAPIVTEPTAPVVTAPAVTEPVVPDVTTPAVTEPLEPEITEPDEPGPPLSMPVITPGDADGNGVINSADLIAMKKRLLNPDKNSYTIDQFDLNHDSKITVVDFIMLKSMISSGGK